MTLWIILSGHGLMAILASVSRMSTYLMVHTQITTLKGGTGVDETGLDETSSRRNRSIDETGTHC